MSLLAQAGQLVTHRDIRLDGVIVVVPDHELPGEVAVADQVLLVRPSDTDSWRFVALVDMSMEGWQNARYAFHTWLKALA